MNNYESPINMNHLYRLYNMDSVKNVSCPVLLVRQCCHSNCYLIKLISKAISHAYELYHTLRVNLVNIT